MHSAIYTLSFVCIVLGLAGDCFVILPQLSSPFCSKAIKSEVQGVQGYRAFIVLYLDRGGKAS